MQKYEFHMLHASCMQTFIHGIYSFISAFFFFSYDLDRFFCSVCLSLHDSTIVSTLEGVDVFVFGILLP